MTHAPSSHSDPSYMFDNAWQEQHRRLTALETIWDPNSLRQLEALGPMDGWRCLEIGAGAGSVAAWLCGRAGESGRVLATDLDTRFLETLGAPNLDVRRHDIVQDGLEECAFDLVHARLLLEHLPQSDIALRRMIAALKPGGWLVLEEFDHVSFLPDPGSPQEALSAWQAWTEAFEELSRQRGLDLAYGRRLLGLLQREGLVEVRAEGYSVLERGGDESRGLLRLSILQIRDALVATGRIDNPTIDRLVAFLEDPTFAWMSQIMVTARGRRAV